VTARRLVAACALFGILIAAAAHLLTAHAASATVPSSQLGRSSTVVSPNNLRPSECTMTVTSIATGSGTFSASASFQLVLGSAGNDTITGNLGGNDCIVGGAGTDTITGLGTGNQCIVSSSTVAVVNCTVVATRP
jgi:Ca2+-binding RTX toxin-like protein